MALRVVTPPSGSLVALDEAKLHLRVDTADSDDLIAALIAAAQNQVEAITQRRYLAQTLEWVLDGWDARMVLPVAPGGDSSKITVDSVKYYDAEGVQQTLDPDTMYWSRPAGPTMSVVRQRFAVWPWIGDGPEPVVIRFSITSDETDAAPAVKAAMKLLIAHLFEHREAVVGVDNRDSSAPLPLGVEELLSAEQWTAC